MSGGNAKDLLMALCPLGHICQQVGSKLLNSRPKSYGAAGDDNPSDINPSDGLVSVTTGGYIAIAAVVFFVSFLWIYPMVKAFRCPTGNGAVWGIGIFIFPILGIIYLLVGCQPPPASFPSMAP